jgi:hypothetical protein
MSDLSKADRNCPECGTPIDEIPFVKCRYHAAHFADEAEAERRSLEARPLSEKIADAADFEELRGHLADYFRGLE